MMEAVGRRKAHWLFGAGSEKTFSGKRRPQEDMVTSAVFGSIRLMSPEARHRALEILLGQECWNNIKLSHNSDIEIVLWKKLKLEGRRDVEPDVLLICSDKTIIVEAKWKTNPGPGQLDAQIAAAAACQDTPKCVALLLLGHTTIGDQISGPPRFSRTWRDVSGELYKWKEETGTPLSRWIAMMQGFLQETDKGRIFNGLSPVNDNPPLRSVAQATYRFSHPGNPPWLDVLPAMVGPVHFTFREAR